MNIRSLFLFAALAALAGCGDGPAHGHEGEAGHDETGHDDHDGPGPGELERGPHRGRLLRDGAFALEVTIFETGVPPEFHLYAYQGDKLLDPKTVQASVELERLGGRVDRFAFKPQDDHLVGNGVVTEPHSFDVVVTAQHAGKQHRWAYASYEGRTTIPAAVAKTAGVVTKQAGPATIRDTVRLMGRVVLNDDRHAEIRARYPGPVTRVNVSVGDTVAAGQSLATVENAESLRSYAVTAPFAGTVLARHTNVGDRAGDGVLFEVADLSQVWVDVHAFGADAARIAPGQRVVVKRAVGDGEAVSTIDRVLPVAASATQSVFARVALANPPAAFRPGTAVSADVTLGERTVPLAVERAGLQRFRDFTVVFAQFGDTYEVRMLDLGAQDAEHVEVLGGIEPGTPYVTEQSFLIKADIEKSGASHDH